MDKAGGLLNRPIPVAVFWDVDVSNQRQREQQQALRSSHADTY